MRMMLKLAGLCLVATFVLGATYSATASAAGLVWEQCTEEGTTTKYSAHECLTAEATGKWAWHEIKTTEKVTNNGTLIMRDTKTPAGTAEVECVIAGTGTVGPGRFSKIETIKVETSKCRPLKVCENVEKVEALNLPWQTELTETEGKPDVRFSGNGTGEPGWDVKCKVPVLGSIEDKCVDEKAFAGIFFPITSLFRILLIRYSLPNNNPAGKCSEGGEKSGEIVGSIENAKSNGWGLRVG